MNGVPLPVIIGAAMIVLGVALGIYVAIKAVSRNCDGNEPLVLSPKPRPWPPICSLNLNLSL